MHFNQMKHLLIAALSFAALTVAETSQAVVVYSAPPNQSGGSDLNEYVEADDFNVATTEQITQIMFWSFQSTPSDYAGSIEWSINANNAGIPGANFASGSAVPIGVSTGNSAFGFNEFSYTFPVNVVLAPGRIG